MKFLYLGTFQKIEKLTMSHDKIIFHMIFGAFHITSIESTHTFDVRRFN